MRYIGDRVEGVMLSTGGTNICIRRLKTANVDPARPAARRKRQANRIETGAGANERVGECSALLLGD